MPLQYPFSAIVGTGSPVGTVDTVHDVDRDTDLHPAPDLDPMSLALVLATVSPDIGGVLVRGEKGTAKSTMVRALAGVLPPIDVIAGDRFSTDPADPAATSPDGPFGPDAAVETRPVRLVELPVGATEDRVLGSLHLERALSDGKAEYEPGLLARAHRGILYVDEVNLLHDHLVDLLLDAAAMGRSTVERDGISVAHAARFVLVGTMNPEEGELRPQLLDRFGLTVEVAAPRDPHVRVEVVRRRMAYDADPAGFVASYAATERALTERIEAARARVGDVVLDDAALLLIAELCAAFDVDGMRADLVTARAAIAHAAWHGRGAVTREDIRAAARLALPHRRRRNPFDAPGLDENLLDRVLGDNEPEPPGGGPDGGPDGSDASGGAQTGSEAGDGGHRDPTAATPDSADTSSEADASSGAQPVPTGSTPGDANQANPASPANQPGSTEPEASPTTPPVPAAAPFRPRLVTVPGVGSGEQGRRSRAITTGGHRIGARPAGTAGGSIHLVETIRAAAPHQGTRGARGRVVLRGEDLRVAVREGQESNLILFCVDASGSMSARTRMQQVKTAVLSLLLDAYRRRDKVGLVTFRGHEARLALPPTGSVEIAAARLDELPAGGRTPLAEGIATALETLRIERVRDPQRRPLLVLLTDGRATSGPDALARSRALARQVAALGIATLVIDCETGRFRMGMARELAEELRAEYLPLAEVDAQALTDAVRTRVTSARRTPEGGAA